MVGGDMEDSIPIHRDALKHWIYSDAEYFKVWVTMLARARYLVEPKKDIYQNIHYTLNRGEFLFGRKKWNENTGVSEQKLRTLIKKLIKEEMIVNVTTTSKFTIYLIVNYEKFNQHDNQQRYQEIQGIEEVNNHHDNLQLTSIQPASNQHLTTNKESKERSKKVENEKTNIYTPEFELFWSEYPSPGYQNSKQQAFKNFKTLLRKKVSADSIIQAAKNYTTDCEALCKTNYLYKASNFIGQAEYYKSYLDEFWEPAQQELFDKPKQKYNSNVGLDAINSFFGGANGATENNRRSAGRTAEKSEDFTTIDVCFSECKD